MQAHGVREELQNHRQVAVYELFLREVLADAQADVHFVVASVLARYFVEGKISLKIVFVLQENAIIKIIETIIICAGQSHYENRR